MRQDCDALARPALTAIKLCESIPAAILQFPTGAGCMSFSVHTAIRAATFLAAVTMPMQVLAQPFERPPSFDDRESCRLLAIRRQLHHHQSGPQRRAAAHLHADDALRRIHRARRSDASHAGQRACGAARAGKDRQLRVLRQGAGRRRLEPAQIHWPPDHRSRRRRSATHSAASATCSAASAPTWRTSARRPAAVSLACLA